MKPVTARVETCIVQDPDCMGDESLLKGDKPEVVQELFVEIQCSDLTPESFFVLIATHRWAVDSREEWIELWDRHIGPHLAAAGATGAPIVYPAQ